MIINNKYRKIIAVLVPVLVLVFAFCTTINVFAEDSTSIVETTFFGNLKDDGNGCGVYTILNLVIDILSMGGGYFRGDRNNRSGDPISHRWW